jgi:Domain of unknown function (DUF5919)
MSALSRLAMDLKLRRNLDIYLTISVALITSGLSFFGLVKGDEVTAVILATLAILSFTTLATREAVDESRPGRAGPAFLTDFPVELRERREQSLDLYLIGVDLARTIDTSYAALESSLRAGARLRILLVSPLASDAAIDSRTSAVRRELTDMRSQISQSLRECCRLRERTNGNLEIRITHSTLKFGLNFLDVESRNATLFVQLYSFRQPGESQPLFILRRSDGYWFEYFRSQAETLWKESVVYACNG